MLISGRILELNECDVFAAQQAPTAEAERLPARLAEEGLDSQPEDLVEIGVIRSAHGIRGEMKVEPLTSSPEERLGTPGPRSHLPPFRTCAALSGLHPFSSEPVH